jgi:gamma-glutamylcysteine synthetase
MTEQQYIQRIHQLEFALQQKQADYALLHKKTKALIDAAIEFEKTPKSKEDLKKEKFYILKKCEKQLKETIYPNTKEPIQAKLDWLGQ